MKKILGLFSLMLLASTSYGQAVMSNGLPITLNIDKGMLGFKRTTASGAFSYIMPFRALGVGLTITPGGTLALTGGQSGGVTSFTGLSDVPTNFPSTWALVSGKPAWIPTSDPGYQTASQTTGLITTATTPLVTNIATNAAAIANLASVSATQTGAIAGKQNALGFTPIPSTRIISINGTALDLSADRAFTVVGGSGAVSSVNSQTGNVTIVPGATQVIDVEAKYGVVADGVCSGTIVNGACVGGTWSGTDNATNLMIMRSQLAGPNKPMYSLYLPYGTGTILYSNNRWTYGIEQFALFGGGVRIKSIYSGADDAFARPLWVGEMFQNNVLTYTGGKTYKNIYKFNTVTAGSSSLTLTTTSNVSSFTVGNRILLFADDKYGGAYPPATVKNNWRVIKGINTGTGVLTLDTPISYNYNTNVHEVSSMDSKLIGKPSILNLDDASNVYNRYAEFNDVILGDPTGGGQGHFAFPSEHLIFKNVKQETGFWWPSEDKLAEYNAGCVFNNAEPDKLCDLVVCNGITMTTGMAGGMGIRRMEIRNSNLNIMALCPRELIIADTRITAGLNPSQFEYALGNAPGRTGMDLIDLSNLTFNSDPGNSSSAHINVAPFNTFTIAAVSGSNIIIPNTTNFVDALDYKLTEGTRIFKNDGSNGGTILTNTYDATYNSNQGAWILTGTWATAPTVGDTWVFCYVKNVIDRGGHTVQDGKKLWDGNSIRWKGNLTTEGDKEFTITEKDLVFTPSATGFIVDLYGYIKSVKLNVTRPQSGTLSSNLSLDRNTPTYAGLTGFDLLKTGVRDYNIFGDVKTTTTGEGSLPDASTLRQFVGQLNVVLYGNKTAVTSKDVPAFTLTIRYTPY